MKSVSVLKVIFNKSSTVERHIFVKSLSTDENVKSIILLNLPCFVDPSAFKNLIKDTFGDVYRVTFHSSVEKINLEEKSFDGPQLCPMNGHRVAVVRFKEKSSYKSFFNFIDSGEVLYLYDEGTPTTGMKRWQKDYNDSIMDVKELKEHIAKYIASYDEKVKRERELAKQMAGVPDEEGWIKVSRHGKKPLLPNSDKFDKKISSRYQRKRAKVEPFPYVNKVKDDDF